MVLYDFISSLYKLGFSICMCDNYTEAFVCTFLYHRYYELVDPQNGILKKGREVFLTGCYLRTAREGCGSPRLLPTEYLVILLDEVTLEYLLPYYHSTIGFSEILRLASWLNCGKGQLIENLLNSFWHLCCL